MQRIILLVSLFLFSFAQEITAQETHSITVEFHGMESDKGNLYVALYDKEKDFLKKSIKGEIVKITDKKATAVFTNIPEGEYAISAFHDENDNKKMDTRIFGIPKEPIGMSNDAKGFMGPPKYKDAKFSVKGDVSLKIKMN
ncbi:DUF2141 domain-containing protein [Tenacibaculum sp. MEBiC06402]|uniref:DUF2141 domain-containing protein n=1 Tax=unclassified Tenacibaculum TaxID=2635139 RepID=UPI003B9BC542